MVKRGLMALVWLSIFVAGLSATSYCSDSSNSKSVTIRGYTFALADSGDWFTDTTTAVADSYRWGGSTATEYDKTASMMIKNYWIGWHGQVMNNAFYLPDQKECKGQRHCFDDDDWDQNGNCEGGCMYDPDATVTIYVLDKIDQSQLTEKTPLIEAALLSNGYIFADVLEDKASEKDITFDERPARLIETDGMAAMSVELSPDKIAVIDVNYHDGNPWWDVLNKMTISPK